MFLCPNTSLPPGHAWDEPPSFRRRPWHHKKQAVVEAARELARIGLVTGSSGSNAVRSHASRLSHDSGLLLQKPAANFTVRIRFAMNLHVVGGRVQRLDLLLGQRHAAAQNTRDGVGDAELEGHRPAEALGCAVEMGRRGRRAQARQTCR